MVVAIDDPDAGGARWCGYIRTRASRAADHRPGAGPAPCLCTDVAAGRDGDGARGVRRRRCRPGGTRWPRSATTRREIEAIAGGVRAAGPADARRAGVLWRPDVPGRGEPRPISPRSGEQAAAIEAALRRAGCGERRSGPGSGTRGASRQPVEAARHRRSVPLEELGGDGHDVPVGPGVGQAGIEDLDDGQAGIGVAEGGEVGRRLRVERQHVDRLRRRRLRCR